MITLFLSVCKTLLEGHNINTNEMSTDMLVTLASDLVKQIIKE